MIIISFWCIYPVSFLTNPVYNSKLDKFAGPRSQWTASMENQHNTSIFRIKHEVFRIKNLHPKLGKRGLWANLLGWSMLNLGYMNFSKASHYGKSWNSIGLGLCPMAVPQNGANPKVWPFLMEAFSRRSGWSGDPRRWRRLSYRKPLRRGQGTTETSSRWTFCWLIYDSQEELVSISNIMHHSSQ